MSPLPHNNSLHLKTNVNYSHLDFHTISLLRKHSPMTIAVKFQVILKATQEQWSETYVHVHVPFPNGLIVQSKYNKTTYALLKYTMKSWQFREEHRTFIKLSKTIWQTSRLKDIFHNPFQNLLKSDHDYREVLQRVGENRV